MSDQIFSKKTEMNKFQSEVVMAQDFAEILYTHPFIYLTPPIGG